MNTAANTAATSATLLPTQTNTNRSDKQPPIAIVNRLAIKHPVFRRRAGAVLLSLMGRVNHQTGLVWPSVATMANDSGVEERHVQEDLVWMQNTLVNGRPILWWTGLTFGRGVRQYQVNPFFLNPRGDGSGQEGVTDLAGRGDGIRHPEQNKGTEKKEQQPPNPRVARGAGEPDGVVVFSLPAALTAKATATFTDMVLSAPSVVTASVSLSMPTVLVNHQEVAAKPTDLLAKPADLHAKPMEPVQRLAPVAQADPVIQADIASILASLQPRTASTLTEAAQKPATTKSSVLDAKFSDFVPAQRVATCATIPVEPTVPPTVSLVAPVLAPVADDTFIRDLLSAPWPNVTPTEAMQMDCLVAALPDELPNGVIPAEVKAEVIEQLKKGLVREPPKLLAYLCRLAREGKFSSRVLADLRSRSDVAAKEAESRRLVVAEEAARDDKDRRDKEKLAAFLASKSDNELAWLWSDWKEIWKRTSPISYKLVQDQEFSRNDIHPGFRFHLLALA